MDKLAFLMFVILAGCAGPSLEFRGATKTALSLGGDQITVFHTEDRAQAVRTNFRNKSQRVGGIERLVQAVIIATGCTPKLTTLKGDIALITVSVSC